MGTTLKPWQKGVPLKRLKRFVALFQPYNQLLYGSTTRVNQLKMADWVSKKEVVQVGRNEKLSIFHTKILKISSPAYLYRGNSPQVQTHLRRAGDRLIDSLALNRASEKQVTKTLRGYSQDCWLETVAKDKIGNRVAKSAGFKKVAASAASESDVFTIWLRAGRHGTHAQVSRAEDVKPIPQIERANVLRLPIGPITKEVKAIASRLLELPEFQNHDGTKYNKNNDSWSALSLRGYSSNPRLIEDPAEKSANFLNTDHGKGYSGTLTNTALWRRFPEVKSLLRRLVPDWNGDEKTNPFFRIRFMALRPNEGELQRHTDLTDTTLGFGEGRKVRIHFPIQTNPKVLFTSWDLDGKPTILNMKTGGCWYLNIRLPHRAINGGKQVRMHLVVDVKSDAVEPYLERAIRRQIG